MKITAKKIFTQARLHTRTFKKVVLVFFVCAIGIEVGFLFYFNADRFSGGEFHSYARDVMKECAQAKHRPSCYDEAIPKLMDVLSMRDAFQVARIVQQEDPAYGYCHVLGHNLSARETAKDPSRWKEVIRSCPSGVCSNGCLHGAAQERFRSDVLTPAQIEEVKDDFRDVCEPDDSWSLTGLERAECYHGLGHLTMYITGADLNASLGICSDIAPDYSKLCYEGAFMQLFQPLDEDDIALVEGMGPSRKEDLRAFCEGFGTPKVVEACWQEGWPLYRAQINTPEGLVAFCAESSTAQHESNCHNMLFYVWAQGTIYDDEELSGRCRALPGALQGKCFGDIANAMLHGSIDSTNKAVRFCEGAETDDAKNACYGALASFATYNIPAQTPQLRALCERLPSNFHEQCYGG